MRVLFSNYNYRIIEEADLDVDYDLLCSDMFKPTANPSVNVIELHEEERRFIAKVEREGVFGYVLERWNPEINCGWEHVDSVWGFVGKYDPEYEEFNHYIVEEMRGKIV